MNARERVLTALDHREADRVPVAFDAPVELAGRLREHFGVEDNPSLYRAMGIDGFNIGGEAYVFPEYTGPNPYNLEYVNYFNFWGVDGHQKDLPLAKIESVAQLDEYLWPQADWFSFDHMKEKCREIKELGLPPVGGEGGCGLQHCINMRGYDQALMDPYTNPDLAHAYLERMGDFFVEWNERWISAGDFDIFRSGDEIGSNISTHCNPDVWREFYKPQLKRIFAVAKKHGLKIWFHCCGCCRPLIEDLIEIGVDLWDPISEYVAGNNHVELKREFGDRLSFVGGVDVKNVVMEGTPAEVREEVRKRIDILAPGGGYIVGGSHGLFEDCPFDNVLAMYDEAVKYGVY